MYISFYFGIALIILSIIIIIIIWNVQINSKKGKVMATIILSLFIIFLLFYDPTARLYEIDIDRDYSTLNEKLAIENAEDIDIATLLNITRYEYGNEPPDDITAYVWPSIIDSTSINYYKNKVNQLEQESEKVRAELKYNVKCKFYENIAVRYDNETRYLSIIDNSFFYGGSSYDDFQFVYFNFTGKVNIFIWMQHNNFQSFNEIINNSYLITQSFSYSENYGSLAAYGGGVKQLIILDSDMQLKMLIIDQFGGWIA